MQHRIDKETMLAKQYEQLFQPEIVILSDDEESKNRWDKEHLGSQIPISESKAPISKEQEKIISRFNTTTGMKSASQIPSDYFIKKSTIAMEDSTCYNEIPYNPPAFKSDTNYFSLFWRSYVENEKMLTEI